MSDKTQPAQPVLSFVKAVQRRIFAIRVAESVGLASAIASLAGLTLMPIVWLRGQSGIVLALAALAVGVVCGLIWGISRRPSADEAAAEADRQLHLHDLLATVLFLNRRGSDDPWREAVFLMAASRCRQLRPSAVVVARLNLRAWGGVGISAALVLTLGMLITHPVDSQASAATATSGEISSLSPDAQQNAQPNDSINQLNNSSPDSGRPAGSGTPQEDSARNFASNQLENSQLDQSPAGPVDSHNSQAASSVPGPGQGGGLSITRMKPTPQEPNTPDGGNLPPQNNNGNLSSTGGNGQAVKSAPGTGPDVSGTVAPDSSGKQSVPPWKSKQWAADSNAAKSAIDNGQVPSEDADLVRDYFQSD